MSRQGHRGGRVGLAAVAGGALLLSACGTAANPATKLPPQQAVTSGFSAAVAGSSESIRVSLGLTGSQVLQLAHATGGKDVTAQQADSLAASSIVVDVATGHGEKLGSAQASSDTANKFDFAVQVNGTSPLEVRYLGQTIYLKADLTTLARDFGTGTSTTPGRFSAALQKGNQFVPGLAALGQGRWVSLPLSSVRSLFNQFKSQIPASGATAGNKTQILNAEQQLRAALASNTTYASAGTHGGRSEYTVTVQVHSFVQQALSAFTGLVPATGLGSLNPSQMISKAAAKVPANQTAVFQVFESGTKVNEIDLDLRQFDPKLPFAVPIRAALGSAPALSAPSGVTTLDLSKLPLLLGGLFAGGLGGSNHSTTTQTTPGI